MMFLLTPMVSRAKSKCYKPPKNEKLDLNSKLRTDLSNFDKRSRSLERSCFSFMIAVPVTLTRREAKA